MDSATPSKPLHVSDGAPEASDDEPTGALPFYTPTRVKLAPGFELSSGTQLGEYRIEGMIGEGGMGVVFSAVHDVIGKRAAIKILKQELCADQANVDRFVDEARVVNEIGHPNIVDIFAFGEMPDGRVYYVMEYLKGETLHDRIGRAPLAIEEIGDVLKPLARALEAAHAKGVVHRDLKPDNVFLVDVGDDAPGVKLLDFGIAKLVRADRRSDRTAQGAPMGTPQYIAPEQAKGYTVDHRADIYALGVIVFELLTGQRPFEADNAMEIMAKHLMEPPPRPSSVSPSVSHELDDLVLAMLAKEPAGRPALADVLAVLDRQRAPVATRERAPIAATPLPVSAPGVRASNPLMFAALRAPVPPAAPAAPVVATPLAASSGAAAHAPVDPGPVAAAVGATPVAASPEPTTSTLDEAATLRNQGAAPAIAQAGAPAIAEGPADAAAPHARAAAVAPTRRRSRLPVVLLASALVAAAAVGAFVLTTFLRRGNTTRVSYDEVKTGAPSGSSASEPGGAASGSSSSEPGGAASGSSSSEPGGSARGPASSEPGGSTSEHVADKPHRPRPSATQRPSPRLPAATARGMLHIDVHNTGTPEIRIDGVVSPKDVELVQGLHVVEVRIPGMAPMRRQVRVGPDHTTEHFTLTPRRAVDDPLVTDHEDAPIVRKKER